MLFNINESSAVDNYDYVQESKYELGVTGALMHVYENECNYNAIMTSVGISEAKYAMENEGADLFMNESGAATGFLGKIKAFFKAVIEKIKAIFNKFFAMINSKVMKDKEFIKKYRSDILRGSYTDLTIKGYKFPFTLKTSNFETVAKTVITTFKTGNAAVGNGNTKPKFENHDAVVKEIETNRGRLVNGSDMDESDFREALKTALYGDTEPEELEVGKDLMPATMLRWIEETKESTKTAQAFEKTIVKSIDDIIKTLDDAIKTVANVSVAPGQETNQTNKIGNYNNSIEVAKAFSNDCTIAAGAVVQALKDRNSQAKAVCVKLIGRKAKNESAVAEGATDDIFGNIQLI